jgi:hypothetical protein
MGKRDDLRLLCGMGMRIPPINFQFPIDCATQPIVRDHSAHGPLDQQFRVPKATGLNILRFVATHVPRKAHVAFLFLFLPR